MTELQQNRYDRLLRRVGGMIGPGSMVNDVLTELFPMFDVENMPGELLRLSGTRLGMGTDTFNATVAEIPKIQLFNPVDSGLLVTLTTLVITQGVAAELVRFAFTSSALTNNIGNTPFRDTRDGIGLSTVAQVRSLSSAAGVASHFSYRSLADTAVQFHDNNGVCVLGPGTGITIATQNTNRSLTVAFMWRERVVESSELNL